MSQVHLIKHGDRLLARVELRGDDEFVVYMTDEPMSLSDIEELASRLNFVVDSPDRCFDAF